MVMVVCKHKHKESVAMLLLMVLLLLIIALVRADVKSILPRLGSSWSWICLVKCKLSSLTSISELSLG